MSELIKYEQAINKLKLDKKSIINTIANIPSWVSGNDFINLFLPYLYIKIDSREQDDWVQRACQYFGISYELAVKDKKQQTENLKEGDITFGIKFNDIVFDYTNIVGYERKGSASEFCNNCMTDRARLEKEFERQLAKGYKKFVLLLEIGNKLSDLIDYKFCYYGNGGNVIEKSCGKTVFSTVASWIQPNKYAFGLLQFDTQSTNKAERSSARNKLFWLMVYDMFYFFRQEIRLLATSKTE